MLWCLLVVVTLGVAVPAQASAESPFRGVLQGFEGTLFICGGGEIPPAVTAKFVELAGEDDGRLVVIPTASSRADDLDPETWAAAWVERGLGHVDVLHTRSREEADSEGFVLPLRRATAVWITGGQQSRLTAAYQGTRVETELRGVLSRGGVVGGTSAGAACMTKVMIGGGHRVAQLGVGFDLLAGVVVDQHFLARNRMERLRDALVRHPGLVGIGIDEGTAVLVHGRRLQVLGESYAVICLAAASAQPGGKAERIDFLRPGRAVADIVALRRAAIERGLGVFPPKQNPVSKVSKGTLIIVGGGRMDRSVVARFIAAAGGPKAPIVVIPTAQGTVDPARDRSGAMFKAAGAKKVTIVHATTPSQAETEAVLAPLREARGIWFGGGRQWRLVDAYEGSLAHRLFHEVLERGGVIGGSSAGASIQGGYMPRGDPLGNTEIMAEGYERGLNFLPGVAIDQHFAQRGRFKDMTKLMSSYPQLLGLGIDESTAVIVEGRMFEVVGRNGVAVYDWRKGRPKGGTDFTALKDGDRYDMVERRHLDRKKGTNRDGPSPGKRR